MFDWFKRLNPFQYVYHRGNRIRPKDKNLIQFTFLSCLTPLFISEMLMFHQTPIKKVIDDPLPLFEKLTLAIHQVHWGKFIGVLFFSIISCSLVGYILFASFPDWYRRLRHRQKIATMILQNHWYEVETVQNEGFFKDLSSKRSKEKISYFPKFYYQMKQGYLIISVEISLNSYQDQLLHLEKKLESGLYCELVEKELRDSFVVYTLLYDTISNRISIEDVSAKDGSLRLMKDVYWSYDELPHMLLAGGTGGGKSYFILTLIETLLKTNAKLYILDPKNSDLADLSVVLPDVYYRKEDMIQALNDFYEKMIDRTETMKQMDGYKTGENYAYLGLEPHFLIFDEYVAFMDMIGRESSEVMNKIKQIVMLGRQMGFFIILSCQRPDAKYLGDGIRDQFMFRVALGRMSELGYGMMFGDTDKDFFQKRIRGRGYVDSGTSVISEFYTPLVPRGHDFIQSIKKLYEDRNDEIELKIE
ncbi:FtsK/SpoIIIE domain-containing protein [Enterococcus gilvus]|uniref:FtsK/SpoIIIE family cell division protein n=1 Tax=Enterococcus gilvus ATCC BAA-350 TaxID=1158614 RepID=R2XLS2_9ENTE|nr:FtsK/SpoIIIE domain-containing protein [Enterococcus gilvus]EOI55483.1 FtsK/SpoIIIE family cell division protein [Enterococcus gilvus ATCC BAA-350]EOW81974.1 FtsK/SpoIIIE family cell division protein [Enterococcus gilvus ATCC BAA-350]